MHLFPSCFTLGNILLLLIALFTQSLYWLLPIGIYVIAIFCESLIKNRSIKVALLSVLTSYIQLFGYGLGFLQEAITGKAFKQSAELLYRQ